MSTWLAPSIGLPTNGLPISLSIPSWPTAYIPTTRTNDAPTAPTVQTSPTDSVGDSTKAVLGAFERIHARQLVPFDEQIKRSAQWGFICGLSWLALSILTTRPLAHNVLFEFQQ
jgi:hypothetical protein